MRKSRARASSQVRPPAEVGEDRGVDGTRLGGVCVCATCGGGLSRKTSTGQGLI